ncbi:MAG TPA: hypothetical protein VFC46_11810 [Humisphaera sp.]|nr:hypothetical protein [Humisphaera sp.]
MNYNLGQIDYRRAGLERLREGSILLNRELFAGSVYLSGRAVECILRAVIWKHDTEIRTRKAALDTGHDLRELLGRVTQLGVLEEVEYRFELAIDVQRIGRLWFNNMRFVPTERMKTIWWKLGESGKRRTLKQAAADYHDKCSAIVERCEVLCE